jgi:hypothetical protein
MPAVSNNYPFEVDERPAFIMSNGLNTSVISKSTEPITGEASSFTKAFFGIATTVPFCVSITVSWFSCIANTSFGRCQEVSILVSEIGV